MQRRLLRKDGRTTAPRSLDLNPNIFPFGEIFHPPIAPGSSSPLLRYISLITAATLPRKLFPVEGIPPAFSALMIWTVLIGPASRLTTRVQITTDGHRAYVEAIEGVFGMDVDYAMLMKLYGNPVSPDTRYSPGEVIGTEIQYVTGSPDPKHIVCGAPEPHHAYVDAPVYSPHQCVLKEAGEPRSGNRAPLHALQLLPDSQDAMRNPGNGGWLCKPCLARGRIG